MKLTNLLIGVALAGVASHTQAADVQRPSAEPNQVLGKVPLAFETNAGQTDPRVKYFARGNGYTAFLTANEAVLALTKRVPRRSTGVPGEAAGSERGSYDTFSATVRMKFEDASAQPIATPSGLLPARVFYLSSAGSVVVHPTLFQKVSYTNVWPGISVVFYGSGRQMEYDFVVEPGRSPTRIKLAFDGAESVQVDPLSGDLVLTTGIGELRQPAPTVYQEIDGQRVAVDGRYAVAGKEVGFQIGSFDSTRPLVIDPTLTFADGWGGSGQDYATSIAVNQKTGEIYVAGYTNSPNFPVTTSRKLEGNSDAFVSKISADGATLLFSTYIGGTYDDVARGIGLDASGNVYLSGYTESSDFSPICQPYMAVCPNIALLPVQTPAKFFVVELDSLGSLLFSGVYGGKQQDYGNAIAVDPSGDLVAVVGRTYSPDFPLVGSSGHLSGSSDAFLAVIQILNKFPGQLQNVTPGSILYSTYIGGSGDESAKSVALIPDFSVVADVVVAGWTSSFDFQIVNGAQTSYQGGDTDAFVTRLKVGIAYGVFGGIVTPDPSAQTIYSTYIGGEDEDVALNVTTDPTGIAYLTGYTRSEHYFPTTYGCYQRYYGGGYSDAFIAKVDGYGKLLYATYFGGSEDDYGEAILVGYGAVYLVGYTDSYDLPLTSDAFQSEEAGGWDTFVTIFLDDCVTLFYSSYFGTWSDDYAYGAALDSIGNVIFAGSTNATYNGATSVLLLKLDVGHAYTL